MYMDVLIIGKDVNVMKISEALQIYRGYRQELVNQTRTLVKQRDAAQAKAQISGSQEDAQLAVTLELSVRDTQDKFNSNQEVLDSLMEQWCAVANAEVARQQSDPETGYAAEMAKIMEVARRIASGAQVPYKDEKKLLEYDPKLYQAVKNAAMISKMQDKEQEKYDSLWKDEDEKKKNRPNPHELADNAEVAMALPDIPETSGIQTESPEGQF